MSHEEERVNSPRLRTGRNALPRAAEQFLLLLVLVLDPLLLVTIDFSADSGHQLSPFGYQLSGVFRLAT
jgi:hypothetical protein